MVLNIARRQRINSVLYVEFDKPSTSPTPSKVMRRKERFDRLEEAFNNLSPDYREAMSLVRIQGLQISEAAARMNRTPQAVKHLLIRAIKKLREALGNTESLSLPPKALRDRRDDDAGS